MGIALWLSLKKSSSSYGKINDLMISLKQKLAKEGVIVPSFKPHVTITSGIEKELIADCESNDSKISVTLRNRFHKLVSDLRVLDIKGVDFNDRVYFKNVVLNISDTHELIEFVRESRKYLVSELGIEEWTSNFKPHLSLVYSELVYTGNKLLKQNLVEIIDEFNLKSFSIPLSECRLEIVNCEGPPEGWVTLTQID